MGQCASTSEKQDPARSSLQAIDTQNIVPTSVGPNSSRTNSSHKNDTGTSSMPQLTVTIGSPSNLIKDVNPAYKPESKEETIADDNPNANNPIIIPATQSVAPSSSVPTVIVTPVATTVASASSSSSVKEDNEWCLAAKNILCSLLEKLLEVVDNDREALTAIVAQLNLPNVVQLFNGKQYEALLRETFVLPSLEPTVPVSNPQYDELRLGLFLSVLRSSSASAPASTSTTITYQPNRPSRQQMAVSLVKICQSTQQQLFAAGNLTNDAKLQRHLLFFARTFTFATRSDIVNRIEALYENIDQVIAAS